MKNSPSIIECKDNIIKYSNNNITFFAGDSVFKQFSFNKYYWINELINVNMLNHPNIIKFNKCEIIDDYVIDTNNKEICLDKKEKVVRITMNKYASTLDNFKKSTDIEIFFIMNGLISAVLYSHSNNILHRDIKEKNILVNYKYTFIGTTRKRVLTNVVLADFNISKYKFGIKSINKSRIMTISHRPPEVSLALRDHKHLDYDSRVDVWSFCIVLSFLITGKSFYSFINGGYLKIDPSLMYNVNSMIIAMSHFLKIFLNKTLIHNTLYKKIIFMGMSDYINRTTFHEIHQVMRDYINVKNIPIKIEKNNYQVISPEQELSPKLIYKSTLILTLHNILQYNNIILATYYKFYNKLVANKFSFNEINMVALYIISSLLILDEIIPLDVFTDVITKHCKNKNITNELIEKDIIKIIKFNNFNMF